MLPGRRRPASVNAWFRPCKPEAPRRCCRKSPPQSECRKDPNHWLLIFGFFWFLRIETYAETDELVVKDHPRQEVNERDVGGEEGHHVGGVEDAQCVHVHPIGAHPQAAEEATPAYKCPYRTPQTEKSTPTLRQPKHRQTKWQRAKCTCTSAKWQRGSGKKWKAKKRNETSKQTTANVSIMFPSLLVARAHTTVPQWAEQESQRQLVAMNYTVDIFLISGLDNLMVLSVVTTVPQCSVDFVAISTKNRCVKA